MNKYKLTIGAFAIIRNEAGEILLCHRNDLMKWNFPGGGMEQGESPWDAVVREVKEETGLDVKVLRLISVYSKTINEDICFDFECEIIGGKLIITDEADKSEYFFVDNLPSNILLRHRVGIEDFIKNEKNVILKKKVKRLFISVNGETKEY